MAKKPFNGFKNDLSSLLDGLINLDKKQPEINRHAIAIIAKDAVRIAKEKIKDGDFEPLAQAPTEGSGFESLTHELTFKIRDTERGDGPPLTESGALRKSIKVISNTVYGGNVYVSIGSDLVYAAIHEYGGTTGGAVGGKWGGYIPPRPYLRPAIEEAIENAIDSGLDQKIANAYDLAIQQKDWKRAFD